jgi:hypothetical protein
MTDFRALCEELLDELELWSSWHDATDLKDRAGSALHFALAEQPVGPTEGVKLRYSLNVAQDCGEDRHPQIVMQILDITYQDAEPQPIANQWMFHGCKNVPSELPEYLTVLARWYNPTNTINQETNGLDTD